MKFSLILILFISMTSWAQTKNIVLELDGAIIQRIQTNWNFSLSNRDPIIYLFREGKETEHYLTLPSAQAFIKALSQKNFTIHIVSRFDEKSTLSILESVKLPEPINTSLGAFLHRQNGILLTSEDFEKGKIDLTKIDSDLRNTVFVTTTSQVSEVQSKYEMIISRPYFFYKAFQDIHPELPKSSMVPKERSDWELDQGKLAYAWEWLRAIELAKAPALVDALQSVPSQKETWSKSGLDWEASEFQEEFPRWRLNEKRSKVIGCALYSASKKTFIGKLELQDCLDAFGSEHSFKTTGEFDSFRVTGCEEKETKTKAVIRTVPLRECTLRVKEDVVFFWEGSERKTCSMYYYSASISNVDRSLCSEYHQVDGKIRRLTFDGQKYIEGFTGILDLNERSVIPGDIYKRFESTLIAEEIVKHIHKNRENRWRDLGPDYDFLRHTRLVMAANFEVFEKIKKNGFLNQHQTSTSKGTLDGQRRARAEDKFAGLKLEETYQAGMTPVNAVRPKYAYLLFDRPRVKMGETKITDQYGNIFFKFKDAVKKRATYTPGDSLTLNQGEYVKTFYKQEKHYQTLNEDRYWEAQIWGELTLADVDYVLVNCPSFRGLEKTQISALKVSGLKVYQCDVVRSNEGIIDLKTGIPL